MGIFLMPFALLLKFFYDFFQSYGIALILFALIIKLVLFPFSLKGKKSMIQMNLLSGKMQQLQKQYGKDRERYIQHICHFHSRRYALSAVAHPANLHPCGCLYLQLLQ